MRNLRLLPIASVIISALVACSGCNSKPEGDPPPFTATPTSSIATSNDNHTVRDLCGPLLGFFENELHAVDLTIRSTRDLDAPYSGSGYCTIDGDEAPNGFAQVYEGSAHPDPTGGRPGFTPVNGYGADVWLREGTPNEFELATRINGWNGLIHVYGNSTYTAAGRLIVERNVIDAAAAFIVRTTQDLSS